MAKLGLALIGLALAALVAAMAFRGEADEQDRILVVGQPARSMPAGCSPRQIADVVMTFIQSYNEGVAEDLDALIAPDPTGSIGEPEMNGELGFERYDLNWPDSKYRASSRRDLFQHFARRRKKNETLTLITIAVSPWNQQVPNAGGGFFTMSRTSDDLRDSNRQILDGKVGINCRSRTIFAWVIYGLANRASLCSAPSGWTPDGPVLACVARSATE